MPKPSRHALIWSAAHQHYELHIHGHPEQCFSRGDEPAFSRWLDEHTAFAFLGQAGRISVLKEARRGGRGYWYACRTHHRHTRKRYLGRTSSVSLARLEETAQALSSEPAPPLLAVSRTQPKVEQSMTLLSTKLSPPCLPNSLVPRDRLLADLDSALSTPLTLLSASAGWGKTTLLSVWASRHPNQVAWLSLDSLDNEPFRFWAAVIAALRRCRPGVGAIALAMLHSPEPPPFSAILTAFLNDLAEVCEPAAPLLLLLDDYQVIIDPAIHETLTFWLEHLPARMHLLLSSRVDPDLPLSRLRARGQVAEVRTADLRFRLDEAGLFLRRSMGLSLSEAEVAALERRTEGWVAGLQLAALSLRKQQDRSAWISAFTGGHRYLMDYVQQDILARLLVPLQNFLLHTSILTSLNAALCQAVTAVPSESASQEMLEELERANLFVVPLDEERRWYRFHELFRETLLARLQASHPELVPRLHQRATQWYEAQGELREAIAHALAARDYPYAASLMEREASHLWLRGEAQVVQAWLAALPDAVLWQHARLALNSTLHWLESLHEVVSASYSRAQTQVEQTMARLEAMLQSQERSTAESEGEETLPALPDGEMAVIHRRLRLLRALIAAREILRRGDTERLRLLVQEIEGLDEPEEVSWKMIFLSLTFWLTESQGALQIKRLLEAKHQVLAAADHRALVRVVLWLAFAYLRAGQWRLVELECLEALALVEQIGEQTAMTGYFHYFLMFTYYAWNRLEDASRSSQQLLRIAHAWQQADLLITGDMFLVQLEIARGDLTAADQALQQAEALVQQERFAVYAFWVVATRVRYWLAAGDLDAASHWAEQVVFSPETWDPNQKGAVLMQIRVSLAQHQYTQALQALERWSSQLGRPGDLLNTIEFLALQVVALHSGGKQEQVQAVAARLLALTEPEGYIRVYLDLGEPMKQVLGTLLTAPHEQHEQVNRSPTRSRSFVAQLLAAFEQEEKHGRMSPRTGTPLSQALAVPGKIPSASPAPGEPLTRREQEVLRLLAEGASNQEIANALVIQLSTVKKHVSNLLGKLGAANRTQAIAQARTCSLL
jgi:ATP/maltotriose-dependent transcriptional regulator MalT